MFCQIYQPDTGRAVDRGSRITMTYIGQEFGWDYVDDVNWELLRQNRDAAELVIDNLHRYPDADVERLMMLIDEIDQLVDEHFDEPECLAAFYA